MYLTSETIILFSIISVSVSAALFVSISVAAATVGDTFVKCRDFSHEWEKG